MKFLLHSSNATFDSVTKTWTYNLDRRISNPRQLQVERATFVPISTLSPMPHVIYMHSVALSRLLRKKHTVVLTGVAHENAMDVIAVLEETHQRGRYAIRDTEPTFATNADAHNRTIDIFFTDGAGNRMDGYLTQINVGAAVTALQPTFFFNWEDTAKLVLDANDDVTSLVSQTNGITVTASAGGLDYDDFGETKGVTSTVAWHALSGGSVNTNETDDAILTFMFKTRPQVNNGAFQLIQTEVFKPYANTNVISYYDAANTLQNTSLAIAPSTAYLLQIRRTAAAGQNVPATFDWVLRNLSTDAEQTESTAAGADADNNGFTTAFSTAQSGFIGASLSHAILIPVNTDAAAATCKDWMLQAYAGTVEYVDGEHASFFAQLKIKTS